MGDWTGKKMADDDGWFGSGRGLINRKRPDVGFFPSYIHWLLGFHARKLRALPTFPPLLTSAMDKGILYGVCFFSLMGE